MSVHSPAEDVRGCSSLRVSLQVAEDGSALAIPVNATMSNQAQRSGVFPCLGLPRMCFPLFKSFLWHSARAPAERRFLVERREVPVGLPWDCRGIAVGLPWDCCVPRRCNQLPPAARGRASPSPAHGCPPLSCSLRGTGGPGLTSPSVPTKAEACPNCCD